MRSRARSFYLASLFLPSNVRRDVHLVYAFYRTVDDLVDEPQPGRTPAEIQRTLAAWERDLGLENIAAEPVLAEVTRLASRYDIPVRHFAMVVRGARLDCEGPMIETLEDLRRYSLLVAGSVGMVMAQILGAKTEEALTAARELGIAMQLTNILRDVGEDLRRGRIYLPRDELERAGCPIDLPSTPAATTGLRNVMALVSTHARGSYARGVAGIHHLDPRARFSIYLAAELYAGILDKVEARNFDVFARRAHLSAAERWAVTVRAYTRYRRYWPMRPACVPSPRPRS
jgi:15-cis-phytoene synthase